MASSWHTFSDWLLDGLFPQQCLGCQAYVSTSRGFCIDCREQLVRHPPSLLDDLPLYAPYCYGGPLAEAIVRLKYADRAEFAPRLVRACLPPCAPSGFDSAMLVPVPMHPERLRARGYNQAALLARALGRLWRRPVAYRWLRRQRLQVRQVGLGKAERTENVRGAFAATRVGLEGCRVLLVDDVVTTGSTLRNCATTLSDAGALVVGAVALARAERAPLVPAQPRAEEAFLGLGQ